MSVTIEERLANYAIQLDEAVRDYANGVEPPSPEVLVPVPELRSHRRRFRYLAVAAGVICVVGASAAILLMQRNGRSPSSVSTATTKVPSTAPTRLRLHTINGKSFGPKPYFSGLSMADYRQIPDYVGVWTRDGLHIAGYVKKTDLFPIVGGRPVGGGGIFPVYADGGSPLVGHFYPGKGFVALDENPANIPNRNRPPTVVTVG
jgi:hypothetical protein